MEDRPRVVVIGGGISGLAAAYFLRTGADLPAAGGGAANRAGSASFDVTLVEAADSLGGKICTRTVADQRIDLGPDALLVRSPEIRGFLDTIGLTDAVVAPSSGTAYIWSRHRLRRLPAGTVFGVPGRLLPLLRSGLLSPAGMLRAAGDLLLPRRPVPSDPSVAELLRPRFGDQVFERLIEPLLGGVHAGRAAGLSARSTLPEIEAVARRSRSVYLGLRRRTAAGRSGPAGQAGRSGSAGPILVSLDGGIGRLVDTLVDRLDGAELRTGTTATALRPLLRGGYHVRLADGAAIRADAVVLATPAPATAALLEPLVPAAAEALREIEYASVASVLLAYPPTAVGSTLPGTGFLVPPQENRLLVGCTWLSQKWPHLAGGRQVLIRCLVGRHGDPRGVPASDRELIDGVHRELTEALHLTGPPQQSIVQRWEQGMPQYTVGHGGRLARIEAALAETSGLYLTGAAYRGVGMAACITLGRQVAESVRAQLAHPAGGADHPAGGAAHPAGGADHLAEQARS